MEADAEETKSKFREGYQKKIKYIFHIWLDNISVHGTSHSKIKFHQIDSKDIFFLNLIFIGLKGEKVA